jgi:tetratricopeptide (TPR) repeat protein
VNGGMLLDMASVSTQSTKSTTAGNMAASPSLWYSSIDVLNGVDYNADSLGLDMSEPLSMTDDSCVNATPENNSKSSKKSRVNSADEDPNDSYSDEDLKIVSHLFEDLNTFFMQIRNSDVSIVLIESLIKAPKEEQMQIEQFIWLSWSKHPNRQIQKLMKFASALFFQKKFKDACEVLDAVIKIDPKYTEAYNKRATVQFGLRKAHSCFADIDWVLTIQPYHYGALYAKALMFMKLSSYQAALYTFERAVTINPLLATGSLGKNVRTCKAALHAQLAQGSAQKTTNEHTAPIIPRAAPLQSEEQQAYDDYDNISNTQVLSRGTVVSSVDSHAFKSLPISEFVDDESLEAVV